MLRKYFYALIAAFALIFAALPFFASAATQIYFEVPPTPVPAGSPFSVTILLDADQIANAYAVTVAWSGPIQFVNSNNANSIITLWQKNPAVTGDTIHFEGGALAPFAGDAGQLLVLNFKAIASGTAKFAATDASVYLANGAGTSVTPQEESASVVVGGTAASSSVEMAMASSSPEINSPTDTVPPEIKFLGIVNDPSGDGLKLVSFLVADAGSGVQASYVRYRTNLFWTGWQEVANPAPVPGNAWEVDFRVEDNAGNVAEQMLYDWPAAWILIGEAVIILLALGALGVLFFRHIIKK